MPRTQRPFPLWPVALLLLAAGVLLSLTRGTGSYASRLVLLSGLAAVIWATVRAWPALRLAFRRLRLVAEPGPALVWFLCATILLACAVGFGITRFRWDLTARKVQSLSAASRAAIQTVPGRILLIGLYSEDLPERAEAKDLLEIYRTAIPRIETRMLDPERRPQEARALGVDRNGGILVQEGTARELVTEVSEAAVTQAILRVADPRHPVVAILQGHGEVAPGRSGLSKLDGMIGKAGLVRWVLRLSDVVDVPEEVRVVLLAGPTTPLLPGEVDALGRFLDRGGRLGVFIDPETRSGLEPLFSQFGTLVDGRTISDPGPLTASAGMGPETIAVQSLGDHAVTRGLSSVILLPGATRARFAPPRTLDMQGAEILKSAPTARLLEGPGGSGTSESAEAKGSIPLGTAAQWEARLATGRTPAAPAGAPVPEKPYGRIVVVGDSDFLRDNNIDLYGNREFAQRILGWLSERDFLLRIPPANRSGTPLRGGMNGLRTLYYLTGIVLPLGMLGLGLLAWSRRR